MLAKRAATSIGQKPLSSGAPDKPSQATPVRNRAKGAKAPTVPPRKLSVVGDEVVEDVFFTFGKS